MEYRYRVSNIKEKKEKGRTRGDSSFTRTTRTNRGIEFFGRGSKRKIRWVSVLDAGEWANDSDEIVRQRRARPSNAKGTEGIP